MKWIGNAPPPIPFDWSNVSEDEIARIKKQWDTLNRERQESPEIKILSEKKMAWHSWRREALIRVAYWCVGLLVGWLYWSGPLR